MKLKAIILLFLIISPFLVSSQNFNGGIILGGNMSQLDGDGDGGYSKLGFLGGALVSLQVSEKSSFQMEMEYIGKGSRVDSLLIDGVKNDFYFSFYYLEIPLLYQFSFNRRLSLEAGPAADILLGSYEESNGQEQPSVIPLRPVTLSGIFGGSVFLTQHLKFNIRFNYSILSIRNTKGLTPDEIPEYYRYIFFEDGQYNNVISFSLLWYFKPHEL